MDQNSRVSLICGGIIKWGVFLFVFLLPLFFLPFNSIILELNKQLLLVAFAVILLISWLGKMIAESRIEIKKSFLNLGIIFFLIFYLASSLFSPNRYQSLVGFGVTTGESFFTLLALAVIFYVIVNNFKTKEDILNIASILTASGLVAGILGMLQLMGKFFLPWDFAKDIAFNTIGSINSLEIFLGFLLIVSSVLFAEAKAGLPRQIFFGVASLFFLFMVLSINFTNVWIIALISTVLIVALGIINRDQISQFRLILPMVVLVFAVLMLLVRFNIFNLLTVPSEVSPSLGASVQIDKEALEDKLLFGSGPGNYSYVYGRYKSQDLNQTNFWNVRFSHAFSKALTLPSTVGLAGFLIGLLTAAIFIIYGFWKLIKSRGENWPLALAMFSGWLFLALGQALYSTNLTLEFSFWIMLALAFLSLRIIEDKEDKKVVMEFGRSSPMASILSFSFVVAMVLSISALYLGGSYYYSDILFKRGLNASARENNLEKSSEMLSMAARLNPFNDLYLRTLAQSALLRVNQEFNKSQSVQRDDQIRILTAAAIDVAKESTNFGPLEVENWTQRAAIYRAVMTYTSGAEQWVVDCYKKAIELEPNNPFYHLELGRSRLLSADLLAGAVQSDAAKKVQRESYIKEAQEAFNRAIALKSDYAPALFQLAIVYDNLGKTDEAIAKMEQTKNYYSQDTGIAFQLGVLHYKKKNWSSAQAEFERAIILDENYSNARYFLGLIYDRNNEKKKAIKEFEKIESLNPENQEIKNILANLRAGKAALAGIESSSGLPIEEKSPESVPEKPAL